VNKRGGDLHSPRALHELDDNRFKQIVLNLLSNAVKFTSIGSVVLSIEIGEGSACEADSNSESASPQSDHDVMYDKVMISVEDTGIGIKDTKLLLDSCQYATKSTALEYGGTGLGLSISKSLTELMGGKVREIAHTYRVTLLCFVFSPTLFLLF
jgi:signal transduction histidine kinase